MAESIDHGIAVDLDCAHAFADRLGISPRIAAACLIEEPLSRSGAIVEWVAEVASGRAERTETLLHWAKKQGRGIYGLVETKQEDLQEVAA